jgi:hypothetical protein
VQGLHFFSLLAADLPRRTHAAHPPRTLAHTTNGGPIDSFVDRPSTSPFLSHALVRLSDIELALISIQLLKMHSAE